MSDVTGCPVSHTNFLEAGSVLSHYDTLDREREESRFLWNDSTPWGFWMVQRYEDVREGLQSTDAFTCEVTSALNVPRQIDIKPNMLDGDAHTNLRRVLNPFFSPAAVKRMEPHAIARCIDLVQEVQGQGHTDLVNGLAIRYPTDIFLTQLGVPVEDAKFFLPWVETVFGGLLGPGKEAAREASNRLMAYFDDVVTERRKHPGDPTEDLVTRLIEARIDDAPIPREDILTICMTLMLAGLDTTRSALGYIFRHLAVHDEDRRLVTTDAVAMPKIIEECLRLYPLVIQAGRRAEQDVDFRGLHVSRGDVMWMGIGSANRDPRKFADPERFDPDRPSLNQHIAFGVGPHRCLGMHLARLELAVVVREWHARIPDYRLAADVELVERGGQLSLLSLPLEWDVTGA